MRSIALPRQLLVNRLIWLSIVVVTVFDFLLLRRAGMTVVMPDPSSFIAASALMLGGCAAASFSYRYLSYPGLDKLYIFSTIMNQLLLSTFMIGLLSYLGGYLNMPLMDKALADTDRIMGFDWMGYMKWTDARPALTILLSNAYHSYLLQFMVFICLAAFYKNYAHAQRVIIIYLLSGLVTATLAAWLPAHGEYIYHGIGMDDFRYLSPSGAHMEAALLSGLRDHSVISINLPFQGIIIFPSFHSILAVLLAYAWLPFSRLRWFMTPVNIAMLFSTPVIGGHYLTDVLAGVIIAGACIVTAGKILPPALAAKEPAV